MSKIIAVNVVMTRLESYLLSEQHFMKLGEEIIKLLSKQYEPDTVILRAFKGSDLAFKTDAEGKPVLLFIGKRLPGGKIKGERFARRYVTADNGTVIKDHWDHKGKAS
jgi:hypothetical protein